ncbi:MAG: cupin domain-containing protein, partial [Candidatus Sulfotelmatobacter sp.]
GNRAQPARFPLFPQPRLLLVSQTTSGNLIVVDRKECLTPDTGQTFQAVVRAGCWFASHVADWKSWALVGCTVAPGFEFADFEMGKREELTARYPQHGEIIRRLTREE